jgi:hypothetical protein
MQYRTECKQAFGGLDIDVVKDIVNELRLDLDTNNTTHVKIAGHWHVFERITKRLCYLLSSMSATCLAKCYRTNNALCINFDVR